MRRADSDRATGASWALSFWIFLRLLGVVYFVAFWSLDAQILGLAGSQGIEPAATVMANARAWADEGGLGLSRYLQWPTLCWFAVGDAWLTAFCRAGMALSALLVLGLGSVIVLPALWLLYLSLATVTGDFLAFQWDALLLETGAVAAVAAPWRLVERPGTDEPPRLARWLLWWLLFRLMFASGVVKLTSGDPLWRSLDALMVHFETQPLPTPVAWYAHQLPAWLLRASTAVVFVIELIVPWCSVAGLRARRLVAIAFVGLQAAIALTGNFAFFNLLSASLALALLDDGAWHRLAGAFGRGRWPAGPAADRARPRTRPRGRWVPAAALALVVVPVSVDILARQARVRLPGSDQIIRLREPLLALRSVNAYGLFAVMTRARPEITVEGSIDGVEWRTYRFLFKPGRVEDRPRWVAPYQPRLDWQMWFAALGEADESPWFERFCRRLLDGSPAVLDLLAENPFPGTRPRYVRATRARYRWAAGAAAEEGRWWERGVPASFAGPFTASGPALQ